MHLHLALHSALGGTNVNVEQSYWIEFPPDFHQYENMIGLSFLSVPTFHLEVQPFLQMKWHLTNDRKPMSESQYIMYPIEYT